MNDQEKERTGANLISTMPITLLFWSSGGMGQWVQIIPPKTLYCGSHISRSFGKKLWRSLCWPLWKLESMKNPLKKGSNCRCLKKYLSKLWFSLHAVENSFKENKLKLLTKLISLVVQEILLDASRNCIIHNRLLIGYPKP
jgi:hypothetical protein